MFTFNFAADDTIQQPAELHEPEGRWEDSKEVLYKDGSLLQDILKNGTVICVPNYPECRYMDPSEIVRILKNHKSEAPVLKAEENHSDLISTVYEGGLQIWECSYDLLNYIISEKIEFKNAKVLDLGCGSGIIGIYSLLHGSTCYFQDYNEDVLQYFTIPNILVNEKKLLDRSKFYSGDWESFTNIISNSLLEDEKFDYIFTSETVYNTHSYPKLHKVFEALLKNNGKVYPLEENYNRYLAAKSFYFGVGGGVPYFKEFLDKNKVFKYLTVAEHTSGIKRVILEIKFNQ
nr:unnamed protein product [Callosobruchus analis]